MKTRPRQMVLVILCLLGALGSCRATQPTPISGRPQDGSDRVPDFLLSRCVHADSIRLYDYIDRPVLLFFFDLGDAASHRAYGYVNEWHRRYQNDGLKVIGIHCTAYEPLRAWANASTAVGRAGLSFPVGMDPDLKICEGPYDLDILPTFILLSPGATVTFRTSGPKHSRQIETAIQDLLRRRKPGIVLPFLMGYLKPEDDPEADVLAATPRMEFGYASGLTCGSDPADRGKFKGYTDPGEKQKGRIFLSGTWRGDSLSVTYKDTGEEARVRVIYSGQNVWLLAGFDAASIPRIYVRQDRSDLPNDLWGKDIRFDSMGRPFVDLRFAVPVNIVSNGKYGTHELELILAGGAATLYCLFFEGAAAR